MMDDRSCKLISEWVDGRIELVFDLLEHNCPANHADESGVSLIQTLRLLRRRQRHALASLPRRIASFPRR